MLANCVADLVVHIEIWICHFCEKEIGTSDLLTNEVIQLQTDYL
jgi:hypothetical protein